MEATLKNTFGITKPREQKPKSKIMLWRQENPKGMGIIVDMRKVLK